MGGCLPVGSWIRPILTTAVTTLYWFLAQVRSGKSTGGVRDLYLVFSVFPQSLEVDGLSSTVQKVVPDWTQSHGPTVRRAGTGSGPTFSTTGFRCQWVSDGTRVKGET